jgi:ABC-type antimicrobial peptide transport system permease subunit
MIEVLGRQFKIGRILPEQGSKEDISICLHLADAQELLGKPGKINQIMALGCRCDGERLPKIRAQLAPVLPETKITEFRSIALARAEQRDMIAGKKQAMLTQIASDKQKLLDDLAAKNQQVVDEAAASRRNVQGLMETLAAITTPLVVLVSGVWVGLLALSNVRERLPEIGLLRALGKGSGHIAALFLGKAVLLGLLGGAVGFVLGNFAAHWLGAGALGVASDHLSAAYDILPWTLLGAPLVCVLASYLPMLSAILQDPAVVLRDA